MSGGLDLNHPMVLAGAVAGGFEQEALKQKHKRLTRECGADDAPLHWYWGACNPTEFD